MTLSLRQRPRPRLRPTTQSTGLEEPQGSGSEPTPHQQLDDTAICDHSRSQVDINVHDVRCPTVIKK